MISRIVIDNFATIEHLSFDLGEGLNIITGETGAGKSVLVTAINTVLGGRADTAMVRTGSDRAVIRIAGDRHGEDVVISREILPTGKSVCKLNGEMVTLGQIRMFCSDWVDVHGQYDNQQILDPDNHIHITDRYSGDLISSDLERLQELYTDHQKARREYEDLLAEEAAALRQRDFYQFEYDHISGLALVPGEDDELREQLAIIKNSSRIYSAVRTSYDLLHEIDGSVLSSLGRISDELGSASAFSEKISSLSSRTQESYYELEDISERLREITDSLNYSEDDLDRISERLSVIEDAVRKYHRSVDEIIEYGRELEGKLSLIENFDHEKARLAKIAEDRYSALQEQADIVNAIRHDTAARLEKAMAGELADLDFANSDFRIDIGRLAEIGPLGYDRIEFMISTNPGQPLMPLARIASGGEISRIMLAFKHIIGDSDNVETMIFDEIDTGISGRTALTVGRKMSEIAAGRQIISVTHLPQIASYGDDNYLITKSISDGTSHTNIDHLDSEGKVRMLAALFSGSDSDSAMNAARELIGRVHQERQ